MQIIIAEKFSYSLAHHYYFNLHNPYKVNFIYFKQVNAHNSHFLKVVNGIICVIHIYILFITRLTLLSLILVKFTRLDYYAGTFLQMFKTYKI